MKRCPECRRDYHDNSLSYCLDDGAVLLDGPLLQAEPATAILSDAPQTSEPATRTFDTSARADTSADLPAARTSMNKRSPLAAVIGLVVLIVLIGIGSYMYLGRASSERIGSIAVMPFENRSGNSDTDYLSDGLTDSLIFRLSQLPDLKVSPTSSVMHYHGTTADISQIAKELDVDAVMSGRLAQVGDALNISVQLTDARTKKVIWAEQYDRKMADLLSTQREIATAITQKLQLKLSGNEKGIAKKYTNSNEAYQLYLKGRYYWAKRSKDEMFKAVDSYKQAIALDTDFALAYAALAEVYNSMAKDPDVAPKDAVPFAKTAATRALELDPSLPEAHSAFADSLAIYDWNWTESEREFKKAIDLDPNIAYIHLAYSGSYLGYVGRTNEAVVEAEKAVELEPLSLINNSVLTSSYAYARRYDQALVQAQKSFELDANFPLARQWLGTALILNGQYQRAIDIQNQAPPDSPSRWNSLFVTALAYAKMGDRPNCERAISEFEEIGKARYVRRYYLASVYATLGDKDKAFAELEKAYADRDSFLGRLLEDPFMDPLRDDPRFKDLISRMNLPA